MAFIYQMVSLKRYVRELVQEATADVGGGGGEEKNNPLTGNSTPSSTPSLQKPTDIENSPYLRIPGISLDLDCNEEQYYRVDWVKPYDPFNPHQWSIGRRIFATLSVCLIALVATMASSIDSAVLTEASKEFHVSEVAESLATGLYLIGFGAGGLINSPLSEMVGRYPVYMGTLTILGTWLLGAALAPNFGGQIVFRFLAGFVGSAPLTVAGGSIADIWDTLEKTFGFPMFAIPGFGGPILGPVVGAYIGYSRHIDWRWSEWIMLIFDGFTICLLFAFKRETSGQQLLYYRAMWFRKITGDPRFKTAVEASGAADIIPILWRNFSRPWILTLEPIVVAFTLYLTIVYIVLFTFLDGYPYIFGEVHNNNEGLANICFLGLFVGILLAMVLVPILYRKTANQLKADGDDGSGKMLRQESRLFFSMVGAPAIPIGLFWMGWTSYSWISIWSPLAASLVIGFGIICVFLSAYMYVIDSYQQYAASALTFVALVRYLAAGGMTVVGIPMYRNLGVHWACTVLAIISAVAMLIPYALYYWGPSLRKKSKWAVAFGQ